MDSCDVVMLLFLMIASSFSAGVQSSANLTMVNSCEFTVWPGIFSYAGVPAAPTAGFALQANETRTVAMPSSWGGRIWGRTDCWEDSSGRFSCVTGDCGTGKLECNGTRNVPTVTIAEFRLDQFGGANFYDISLVFGYNLPVLLAPRGGSGGDCKSVGCLADVNGVCPAEMLVTSAGGYAIACKSACQAFLEDQYCCRGSNVSNCQPTQFSQVFKRACPNAFSFALDSANTTFSCSGADYAISFCPPGSARVSRPTRGSPLPPAAGNAPQSSSNGRRDRTAIIAGVVSATVLLILVSGLIILRKIKKEKRDRDLRELLTLEGHTETRVHKKNGTKNHDLRLFSYETILSATCNFSSDNKLGEGGFGSVYKGKTSEGQDLAVKLLSRQSGQGLLEFKTELILISKLQHVNLVKLHGLCIHGDDKMIIYDYMPNKSLDFFLFNPSKKELLNWARRFSIIEGIAQGLLYLHKYSRLKIIHRDLKPSNILLDENMNAKISDFGLARVFEQNIDEANTNRRVGTYGYMAPEYAMQGIFSVKSDVYSFGVLVLEIVSGRKNNCFHQMEGPLNLVEYAWELWRNDSALQLMDPTLQDSCISQQLQRCIHIALLCVENRAVDRPSIEEVILMLKSETMSLLTPKNPSFIAINFVQAEVKRSTRDTSTQNDVTLSELKGR